MRYIIPINLINPILVTKYFVKYIFKLHRLPNLIISVRNKGKWPLFKASCLYTRQVAVIYCRGTSVVRNLKFLTPFFIFLIIIINIILSTNCSYVILPCNINTD